MVGVLDSWSSEIKEDDFSIFLDFIKNVSLFTTRDYGDRAKFFGKEINEFSFPLASGRVYEPVNSTVISRLSYDFSKEFLPRV